MGRKKFCCNPYNVDHKKPDKQIGIQRLTDTQRRDGRLVIPQFDWEDESAERYLCLRCRTRLCEEFRELFEFRRNAEAFQEARVLQDPERPQPQQRVSSENEDQAPAASGEEDSRATTDSDNSSSSSVVASSSISSALSTQAPLIELNRTLEEHGVTPVVPSDSKKPYVLREKLSRVTEAVKQPFTLFSKSGPVETPKTKKGVTTRECEYCKMLLTELGAKFQTMTTSSDTNKLLTCIPKRFSLNDVIGATGCGQHTARHASALKCHFGAFSWPPSGSGRPNIGDLKDLIIDYYLSDSNSRRSPNARDVIYVRDANGVRVPEGKRHIWHNMKELYEQFLVDYLAKKVGLTTFATLRPKQCVWPGRLQHQVVCVCEIHKNFEFLLNATKYEENTEEILKVAVCGNDDCYLGLCGTCPDYDGVEDEIFGGVDPEADEITYLQWVHTDSTEIRNLTSTVEDFKQIVRNYIPKIIEHEFVTRRQDGLIRRIKSRFIREENAVSMQVDFAQNYTCIIQNAVMVR